MGKQLTADDAKESLTAHVAFKGAELREKYGHIGWSELTGILEDRSACRYPCEIAFSSEKLEEGEFAFPEPRGASPEDGFTMHVHPLFKDHLDVVPYLVLYHLVAVNYGDFASPADAEQFGSAALGISQDEYYGILCQMADDVLAAGG